MKNLTRMLALVTVMAAGSQVQAAKKDLDMAFVNLQYGDFDRVLGGTFEARDILAARKNGNTLITEAILGYPAAKSLIRDRMKALAELKKVLKFLTKDLSRREQVKLLNAQNTKKQTALMFAAQKAELFPIAQELYSMGAETLLQDTYGKLASDYSRNLAIRKKIKEWQEAEKEGFTIIGKHQGG